MTLQCLGVNHRTASVGVREQLGYTGDAIPAGLVRARDDSRIRHMVILSTCNRVEVYTSLSPDTAPDPRALLAEFLAADRGVDVAAIDSSLYYYDGVDVARHLCRVAAGLDSLVLGESQILAQVTTAFRRATSKRTVSPELRAVFETAIQTATRARADAWGSREPASMSSVSVDHARDILGPLSRAHVIVVGAGEVASLVVRELREHSLGALTIVNRDYEKASALATRGRGEAAPLETLPQTLQRADVVFVTTGAEHMVVDSTMVASAMSARPDRTLLVADISVPRNVDPDVRRIDGVRLFDVDDIRPHVEHSLLQLRQAVPLVESIIEMALDDVMQTVA